jgi:hypothetical protein
MERRAAGRSGIAPTPCSTRRVSTRFAGEVKRFDPLDWLEKKDVKCARFIQRAGSNSMAMTASGLEIGDDKAGRQAW